MRGRVIEGEQVTELTRAVDRARPCNVLSAAIVSPTYDQGQAVRDAMSAQGFPTALMLISAGSVEIDQVRVTIVFQ